MNRRAFAKSIAACAAAGPLRASHGAASGITAVPGVEVGQFTDSRRPTGCTAIVFRKGAVAGVDVRGAAPGTRETDLLNPINTVQQVFTIMLTGGSAFGLDTASGAMRYLEEQGIGFHMGSQVIPIVPAAVLYDLSIGDGHIRPDAAAGYAACKAASTGAVAEGSVGAGAGATIGKMFGPKSMMKSGLGTASIAIGDTGILVGAIVAVNAVGDVIDPATGHIVAGARKPDGSGFIDTMARLREGLTSRESQAGRNTTIGVVATNAAFDKAQMTKIAQMAHDGLARAINPVHTTMDGDTLFAASTGTVKTAMNHGMIGAIAAEVMSAAVLRAVRQATSVLGIPALRDL
ncbi:MAG TPA: P1 family peptidase [Bryobacteraceae bacterium]